MITISIILAGALLRVLMLMSGKSLWGDEFYTLDYASIGGTFEDIFRYATTTNHPPVYYMLIHVLADLFGHKESVYRLVSCLPGIATVWVVYRIGREVAGRGMARAAALLAAFSPFLLQSSNEMRSYGLLTFVAALATLFFLKLLKKPGYFIPYVLTAVLLVYIEHMGIFISLGITFAVLFMKRWDLVRAQAVVHLFQIPWAGLVLFQGIKDEGVFSAERISEYWNLSWIVKKWAGRFWHLIFGYQYSMLTVERVLELLTGDIIFVAQGLLVIAALGVMAAGLWSAYCRLRQTFLLITGIFLIPVMTLMVLYPIRVSARYIGFAAPLFFVWMAWSLWGSRFRAFRIFLALILLINLHGSWLALRSTTDAIHREDFKEMSRYVESILTPRTLIAGSREAYHYYADQLGLRLHDRHVEDVSLVDAAAIHGVSDVWLMHEVNMDPGVTRRMTDVADAHLARFGFNLVERRRFGGEDALAMLSHYRMGGGAE